LRCGKSDPRRLEAKQYVRHEMKGRQFYSAREPPKVATEAVSSVLKNICRGSLEELLTGLADHRVVSGAELRRLAPFFPVMVRRH
jgi:predicted transcriptional regulator